MDDDLKNKLPEIVSRRNNERKRPHIQLSDLFVVLELGLLAMCSLVVPVHLWSKQCVWIERFRGFFVKSHRHRVAARIAKALSVNKNCAEKIALQAAAARVEHHMHVLDATLAANFQPTYEASGIEQLEQLAREGRGGILWVSHFAFSSLLTKFILHHKGYRIWHVTRPEHGFSKSNLGIRYLNPVRKKIEGRYLAGLIEINTATPYAAARRAIDLVSAGELVSITAGAWEGAKIIKASMFGGSYALASGAPAIALIAKVPIFPVFTIRHIDGHFTMYIDVPLRPSTDLSRDESLIAMAQEFALRHKKWIRRYPEQWRGWTYLQ